MRFTRGIAIIGLLVLAFVLGSTSFLSILTYRGCGSSTGVMVISSQPTIEKLEKIGHLVSLRVSIADVMVAEADRYKGSWVIKGDALIGVDMRQAKVAITDESKKQANISLPLPHVISARVDHNRTLTWSVESNSWINYIPGTSGSPDRLRDKAMKAAQEIIEKTARLPAYISEAQKRTEVLVKGFYEEFGWQIEIVWPSTVESK